MLRLLVFPFDYILLLHIEAICKDISCTLNILPHLCHVADRKNREAADLDDLLRILLLEELSSML